MIYADYNASAPLLDVVKKYLIERFKNGPMANPNANHSLSAKTISGMNEARKICADILGTKSNQIIFNSGATEGIRSSFHSLLKDIDPIVKPYILISSIEHPAVTATAQFYNSYGFETKIIPVNSNGIVEISTLNNLCSNKLKDEIALISIMAANNETGIIQPLSQISTIAKKSKIPYICDTTQYIGKVPFNFNSSECDFAVMSGHKIGALPGTGILLIKKPSSFSPLILGGGQERSLRGGTQNYIGNETLAIALNHFHENLTLLDNLQKAKITFEQNMKKHFSKIVIIGEDSPRLATTTSISYPGLFGQGIQMELESSDIFVSTSSACSDDGPISKILMAQKIPFDIARGVVRISLSMNSDLLEYPQIEVALEKAYKKLLKITSY